MAVLRCPNCGKPNPDFLEVCQYCDQTLRGGAASAPPPPAASAPSPEPGGKPGVIRCPNCGKPNPGFLAECQFCEQPLGTEGGLSVSEAAMQLPTTPTEAIWGAPPGPQNEPDWLWGGNTEDETPAAPAAQADIPDWLQSAAPAAPVAPTDDLPDWMKPAPAAAPAKPAANNTPAWLSEAGLGTPAASAAEEDVPDWLRSLRGDAPLTSAPAPATSNSPPDWLQSAAPSFAAPAAEDDVPDWMKPEPAAAPAKPAAPAAFAPPPPPVADDDLPDWMRGPAEPAPSAPAAPPAAFAVTGADDDLPDWMKPAPSAAPAQPTTPAAFAAPATDDDLPDWMRGGTESASSAPPAKPVAPAAFAAPAADDMPDWMRGGAEPVANTPAASTSFDSDLPDWMQAGAEPAKPAATPAKPIAPPPAATDDMPDWMRAGAEPTASASAASASFDSDLPDWMQAGAEPTKPTAASAKPAAPPAADDLPDWMRAGAESTVSVPAASASFDSDLPDWMQAGAEPAKPAATSPSTTSNNVPDWLQSGAEVAAFGGTASDSLPDWLSNDAETTPAPNFDAGPSGPPAWLEPGPGEEISPSATTADTSSYGTGEYDWLSGGDEASPAAPNTPAAENGDWLSGLRNAPSAPKPTQAEDSPGWLQTLRNAPVSGGVAEPQPSIEGAALPNWLEAMRPTDVEGTSEGPDDSYQETVGVLAGIRGILRAEPVVAKPTKSTTEVHKITITEAQSKQINLIETLLREAAEPKAPPKRRTSWLPVVERLLVFAFILLAILLPFFAPGFFPLPTGIDRDTAAAFTVVESMAPDSVAVVAFDYDVAQRGELDPAAVAIVSHLLRRNVRVLALSTRPTGVGAAEAVLASAKVAARDTVSSTINIPFTATYESGFHYLNLGYLPGGPIGIANFTRDPRTVFTNDFARSFPPEHPMWDSARALQGVTNLSNANLVVVLADTADGVRSWMEQAHPQIPNVPIVVVASASTEPLVRPYLIGWGTDQPIDGLVVGLAGAAKYELRSGQPGNAQRDWGPVNGGLLAAAVLLAGGNLVYGSRNLLRRLRKN